MTRKKSKNEKLLKRAYRLLPILGGVVLLLTIVISTLMCGSGEDVVGSKDVSADFGDVIRQLATERGVNERSIEADSQIRKVDGVFVRSWRVELENASLRDQLQDDVIAAAAVRQAPTSLTPAGSLSDDVRLRIDLGVEALDLRLAVATPAPIVVEIPTATPAPEPTATPRPKLAPSRRGRLAILLDDAGQNTDLLEVTEALAPEVGVAILPFLPYSAETATKLHRAGHEIWVHLPMEPVGYPKNDPGPGAILVSQSEAEIRTSVHTALNNIPHAVGVNNHMGSRATADLKTMTWIMQELGARGMGFIDSRTTVRTVAEEAARYQGVKAGRRHVFLDNQKSERAILSQLEEAIYRARSQGSALAIGHYTASTVRVLERELPTLPGRGADLVAPSELLR
ncbi:MAG: divergent polysaccharide deacetylase family protein [bacterium]|nr:divergent polysaccharide deacetylase family protein [bacterium]